MFADLRILGARVCESIFRFTDSGLPKHISKDVTWTLLSFLK